MNRIPAVQVKRGLDFTQDLVRFPPNTASKDSRDGPQFEMRQSSLTRINLLPCDRAIRPALAAAALALLLLAACSPAPMLLAATATPVPPTATATSAFPSATLRPSQTPAPSATPTPDLFANLGDVLFADDFSSEQGWQMGEDPSGGTSLVAQRLTVAVRSTGAFRYIQAPYMPPGDYYLQVETLSEVCGSQDEYGLVVRMNNSGDHYRWSLNCGGEVRALKVFQGRATLLVPAGTNARGIPGPQGANQLGLRLHGTELRFYLNGVQAMQAQDRSLVSGRFGVFVRSADERQTTISFDNISLQALSP